MSILSIDQSSAFDVVDKDILLSKLTIYNIGSAAIHWIENYLSNRSKYVLIGTSRSRMSAVSRGVPQGSMIGPLLYALLTNDITEAVKDRGCSLPAHQDNSRLFGSQCDKCGTLSVYTDDMTYSIQIKKRDTLVCILYTVNCQLSPS